MRIITPNNIKTTGFLKLLREFNAMLFGEQLSFDEFGLLIVLIINADWDKRHRNFGRLCISNKTLGKIKGLNRIKVSNIKKSLVKKGYLKVIGYENSVNVVEVCNFEKYQPNPDFGYSKIFNDIEKDSENQSNL